MARFLISRGADLHITDEKGYTPLDWAEHKELTDVIRVLSQPVATTRTRNSFGASAQRYNLLSDQSKREKNDQLKYLSASLVEPPMSPMLRRMRNTSQRPLSPTAATAQSSLLFQGRPLTLSDGSNTTLPSNSSNNSLNISIDSINTVEVRKPRHVRSHSISRILFDDYPVQTSLSRDLSCPDLSKMQDMLSEEHEEAPLSSNNSFRKKSSFDNMLDKTFVSSPTKVISNQWNDHSSFHEEIEEIVEPNHHNHMVKSQPTSPYKQSREDSSSELKGRFSPEEDVLKGLAEEPSMAACLDPECTPEEEERRHYVEWGLLARETREKFRIAQNSPKWKQVYCKQHEGEDFETGEQSLIKATNPMGKRLSLLVSDKSRGSHFFPSSPRVSPQGLTQSHGISDTGKPLRHHKSAITVRPQSERTPSIEPILGSESHFLRSFSDRTHLRLGRASVRMELPMDAVIEASEMEHT
eukprot:CAMPEP_0182423030 /NCGR_PEP_ID=MMETSP1167-20130531/8919_1 /TAXON_ID=2988 /ORGANISM="Mallomonas Sp, Strain CCMP3275" /LENGTH=467 /DNA_ID=CAMNT_0024601615 /DNA_START=49 /DNA_END=1452 /DNA_ORIENTATION=+